MALARCRRDPRSLQEASEVEPGELPVALCLSGVEVEAGFETAAKARSELEEAIIAAQAAGHSLREIAELAGMSHESVRQILQRREVKK
jgi:DNA-directed RNA polymerase specialized sigma24 family protein